MKIGSSIQPSARSLAASLATARASAPKPKDQNWWHDLTSGEMLQASLHLTPDKIRSAVDTTKDVGRSLGHSWEDIKEQADKILHLSAIKNLVPAETRQKILDGALTVAAGVGYAAAGVQTFAGVVKLTKGVEERNGLKRLEGVLDIATGAAIATTIGGLGIAPLILAPLAAGLGVLRGGAHAVAGYKEGSARHETQGWMDATRSAAVMGSLLGRYSAVAATAGAILGPIAGAIQITRGFIDLRDGLAEKSNTKEIQGLCDIGAAVGLTMAATGLGVIPGIALTAVSVGARVLYQVSDKFEAKVDRKLDRLEPKLQKAVNFVSKVTDPIVDKVRPVVEKITGWHHGAARGRAAAPVVSDKASAPQEAG